MDIEACRQCLTTCSSVTVYICMSLCMQVIQFYRNHRNVFVRLCETLQPLLPIILWLKKTSRFQASVKKLYSRPQKPLGIFSLISEGARLGFYIQNTVSGYPGFVPCCLQNFWETVGTHSLFCLHICKMRMTTLPQRNVAKLHL